MNKWLKILLIACILITIILVIMYLFNNNSNEQQMIEYTPEEEITKEDMRNTIVTLYFQNKETKKLQTEARMIDSKDLLKEPYKELLMLLIEGPKNEQLERALPENTKINSVEFEKGTVTIDLSDEFIKASLDEFKEENMIYSIVNTLTELKEVSAVKILIDGEGKKKFDGGKISFDKPFERVN